MNTNITGFRWFKKSLHPCSLEELSSLRIGRDKMSSEALMGYEKLNLTLHEVFA